MCGGPVGGFGSDYVFFFLFFISLFFLENELSNQKIHVFFLFSLDI
jgi:hypothetical protein